MLGWVGLVRLSWHMVVLLSFWFIPESESEQQRDVALEEDFSSIQSSQEVNEWILSQPLYKSTSHAFPVPPPLDAIILPAPTLPEVRAQCSFALWNRILFNIGCSDCQNWTKVCFSPLNLYRWLKQMRQIRNNERRN